MNQAFVFAIFKFLETMDAPPELIGRMQCKIMREKNILAEISSLGTPKSYNYFVELF